MKTLFLLQRFTAKSSFYSVDPMETQSVSGHGEGETITVLSDIQTESCLLLLEKESETRVSQKNIGSRDSGEEREREMQRLFQDE